MPSTYEPIASTTLESAVASTTFSSVSGNYTDLVVVINGALTSAANCFIRVGNGTTDTGSNYSWTYLEGTSAPGSGSSSNTSTGLYAAFTQANGRFVTIFNLMSYANTNVFKTAIMASASSTDQYVFRAVSLWRSTSAINTVTVLPNAGNLASGTQISLYGIKAA